MPATSAKRPYKSTSSTKVIAIPGGSAGDLISLI
jgi:hypothetical protein